MEKIDQIEQLKHVQSKVAQEFGLQRLMKAPELSEKQMSDRSKHQIFEALKQEVSAHLSSIDALFNATVVLNEDYLSVEIARFLDNLSSELHDFVDSVASYYDAAEDEEKGGEDEIS